MMEVKDSFNVDHKQFPFLLLCPMGFSPYKITPKVISFLPF